jgi:hypothetical protein
MLKLQGISIVPTNHHTLCEPITDKGTPIEMFMGVEWYNKHRVNLKNRRILFCEQIMSPTLKRPIKWHQMKKIQGTQGRTPKWFKEVTDRITNTIESTGWENKETHLFYSLFNAPNKIHKWATFQENTTKEIILLKHKKNTNNDKVIGHHMTVRPDQSPLTKCQGYEHNNQTIR